MADSTNFETLRGLGPLGNWQAAPHAGFPDPFCDMGSLAVPETMALALRWCEYIYFSNGTYRQAVDRVLSYFITDIEVNAPDRDNDIDDDEKEKYESFFRDDLGIYRLLHSIGMDYLIYGNAFISVLRPFKRYLFCPKCALELPLKEVYNNKVFGFKWQNFEFYAHCPKCKRTGRWGHVDRQGHQEDIKIKRWNPHEMEILWDPQTDDCDYIWKIPAEYRRVIREGKLFHLERANWEVIQAIKNGNHLRFAKDFVFHLKEDALAGIRNRGWGISRIISNFRQVWYVQVLHRYNEAIALDYVIPFRLITPAPQGGGGGDPSLRDPLLNMNMGGFMARVNQMLRLRRKDPAAWFTLPFPVQYQALGGDATQLAPRDLLDQGLEVLLNNVGVPTELMKGSLQIQSAPAALRLFESNWNHLVHNLNRCLAFIADKVSELLSWEPVSVKLTRVTHADDLNRQMAKLQLMMGRQISQTTGLKGVGLDFKEETHKMMDEQKYQAEQQASLEEDMDHMGQMQQLAQGASQGMPGQPGAPGGQDVTQQQGQQQQQGQPQGSMSTAQGTPMQNAAQSVVANLPMSDNQSITPQELMERAQTIAQQLMAMPDSQRQSELIQLKKANPTLHSLVRACIDEIRQQARTSGGAQVLQQQFGGGQQS